MKNLFFITLTFFLFASCGAAQQKYSVSDKKAVKLFEEGFNQPRAARDPQTGGPDFRGGIVLIKKALNREPNFFEAHGTISEFYENIGQNAPAIYHLEEAIRLNPNISGTGSEYFFLANLLSENSQFEESNKRIDQFMKFQMANPELQSEAMSMQANNLFAIEAMKNPVKFDPVNIGPGINTSNPEYFPTITVDGKTILFTRRIKDDRINGNQHEDFYISCLGEDNKWKTAIPMPSNINTIANEGAPTLAPDGRSLIFVACEEYEGYYGENRNGYGNRRRSVYYG